MNVYIRPYKGYSISKSKGGNLSGAGVRQVVAFPADDTPLHT